MSGENPSLEHCRAAQLFNPLPVRFPNLIDHSFYGLSRPAFLHLRVVTLSGVALKTIGVASTARGSPRAGVASGSKLANCSRTELSSAICKIWEQHASP